MSTNLPEKIEPTAAAEFALLTKEQLVERCVALQSRVIAQGKTLPGQPQYMMTPEGYLMWQERDVHLSATNGGIVVIPSVGPTISALGWDMLNHVLRCHIYLSPNIELVKTASGKVGAVRVTGAAVGSVGGVPQVHTLTLTYAFYEMFLGELVNKVKYNKTAGFLGTKSDTPGAPGKWAWFELEGPAGVWADLSHGEIQTCLKTLQDRRSKPDRAAFTFLRRNLIRTFAAGISAKCDGPERTVTVKGWYYPISKDRMERICQLAFDGKQGDPEVEFKSIETQKLADGDEAAAVEAELADEQSGEIGAGSGAAPPSSQPAQPVQPMQPEPKPPGPGDGPEWQAAFDACRNAFGMLTMDQKRAVKEKFPGDMHAKCTDELRSIHNEIMTIYEQQNKAAQKGFFDAA